MEVVLSPEPGSDVILNNAKIEILETGERIFSAELDPDGGEGATFAYLVDPEKRTYHTVLYNRREGARIGEALATPAEVARVMERLGPVDWTRLPDSGPRPSASVKSGSSAPQDAAPSSLGILDSEAPRQGVGSCLGYYYVNVQALDPLFIWLTETMASLNWDKFSGQGSIWDSGSYCQAANPSALGTHWYVSSCGASFRQFSDICGTVSRIGDYYNDDFGDPEERTYVTQFAKVNKYSCETNSAYGNWSHSDSGEFSYLIFGSVLQGSYDSCSC